MRREMTKYNCIFFAGVFLVVVLISFALFLLYYFDNDFFVFESRYGEFKEDRVVRIIDGDTFELASGDVVRLICIDAPERGERGYVEATDFLFSLVYGKEVRLERDVEEFDRYGRLLRYVYVNDSMGDEIFVNSMLVRGGYARVFVYGNNTRRCEEIKGNI